MGWGSSPSYTFSYTFYCPHCDMTYGLSQVELNENGGYAQCPTCRRLRNDGFNQVGRYMFACTTCGARIGHVPGVTPLQCLNSH